jgi:hypothetical protein
LIVCKAGLLRVFDLPNRVYGDEGCLSRVRSSAPQPVPRSRYTVNGSPTQASKLDAYAERACAG